MAGADTDTRCWPAAAQLMTSDHRPVAAAFLLQALQYKREVVEQKLEQCRRVLDLVELSSRPKWVSGRSYIECPAVARCTCRCCSWTLLLVMSSWRGWVVRGHGRSTVCTLSAPATLGSARGSPGTVHMPCLLPAPPQVLTVAPASQHLHSLIPPPCCLPRHRCSLQPNLLELGPLKFGEPTSGHLTLTNTGSVEATYLFVPLPRAQRAADGHVAWDDDQPLCPPWVQLSPLEGVLAPGGLLLLLLPVLRVQCPWVLLALVLLRICRLMVVSVVLCCAVLLMQVAPHSTPSSLHAKCRCCCP
jgi:hypothetical protein